MKNTLIALGILLFALANLVFWGQIGGSANELFENTIYLTSVVLSVLAGIFAVRTYGFSSQHGKAFLLITLGYASWLIGESIWVFYDFVLHISPFPSPADFFYVAAYPLIAWGLIKEIKLAEIKFENINKGVLAGVGLLSLIFIVAVTYFELILAYDPMGTFIDNLALIYGFGNLILIIPAILLLVMAWEYKGGKIFMPWIFIFLGLTLTLTADTLYAVFLDPYLENTYPYESMDLLWIAGYLLVALGFLNISFLIRGIHKRLQHP